MFYPWLAVFFLRGHDNFFGTVLEGFEIVIHWALLQNFCAEVHRWGKTWFSLQKPVPFRFRKAKVCIL